MFTDHGPIGTKEIADNAVTTQKIAASAVTTAKINATAVTAAKIGTSAVTATKIAQGAVITTKIAASAVTTAKINDTAVTAAKIGTSAVTATKIAASAVTEVKLAARYDSLYIDAGAMIPCTTNGALAGTKEYGTNDIDIDYFAFDGGATEERVQFKVQMPPNWNLGTIKAKFLWSSDTGSTAGDTVEFGIKAGALSDNDTIDAALGAAQVITDTLLADNGTKLQITAATPAITVGGSPALGDMTVFEVYRNTDGTDDMAEDAWLMGVELQITRSGTVAGW
jgi:hypothetical protein